MHILGTAFIIIGILGMLLGLGLLIYATKIHSGEWDDTARDTTGRAVLILALGLIFYFFFK